MLQILRSKAQSTIMQAIVVIIALVFIFWGVGTRMMSQGTAAITINGDEISFQQFQKAYEQAVSKLRDQFKGAIPPGLIERLGIKQQVANRFIQETLLRQGAQQMGLIVSPAEIQDTIRDMPAFQQNGSFSLENYKNILSKNGFTPHKFEASIQSDIILQRAISEIGSFATVVSDFEIKDLYNMENESVSVSFAKISPENYADKVQVTDKDLSSWYDTHKENYKTAPQIKLKYLPFNFNEIGKKIVIDDEAVKKYYESNIADFTTQEERQARNILFRVNEDGSGPDEAAQRKKAEEVLKLAKQGTDFSQLARQYSEGPAKNKGGDLGFFPKGKMIEPLDDTVFSMKPGQISDVIRSPFGFHIVKLEKIQPETVKPLAEVHDSIVHDLQLAQAKSMAFQMANECYEGIIGAGSLAAYLKGHPDAVVKETGFFSRESAPAEFKAEPTFLNTAFSLKQGELSSLIETTEGYSILFAEKLKEPTIPPLADVKARVTQDYISEKASEAAKKTAEDILAQAKTGGDFAKLVQDAGLTLQTSGLLSKANPSPKSPFPSSLMEPIFQLSKKSPYPGEPQLVDNNYYIFKFAERTVPIADLSQAQHDQIKAVLLRVKQQQVLDAWLNNLRKKAVVTTHKGLFGNNQN